MENSTCPLCKMEESINNDIKDIILCANCGYSHNTNDIFGTVDSVRMFQSKPELIKDLRKVDSDNRVWYPLVVNTERALLSIDGTSEDTKCWKITPKDKGQPQDENAFYFKYDQFLEAFLIFSSMHL